MEEEKNTHVIYTLLFSVEGIKNVRSILIAFIVVFAPLFYFAYAGNFNLETLLSFEIGVISFIVALTAFLANKESKLRGKDNAYEIDETLVKLEDEYENNANEILEKDPKLSTASKEMAEYNKEQQEMYNKIKTDEKIGKLERKVLRNRLNGKEKKATRIEKQIERLKEEPLYDRTFKDYKLDEFVNEERSGVLKKRKKKGNPEVSVEPTKSNPALQGISMLVRGFTGGAVIGVGIMFSEDIGTIIGFYFVYAIIISFTIITGYSISVFKTLNSYKRALQKKIKIQNYLLKRL